MKITIPGKEPELKKGRVKGKKEKTPKTKTQDRPEKQKRRIRARTNNKEKLIDLGLMKSHNFLTLTEATQTRIIPLTPLGKGTYEVREEEGAVSTILKMIIKTNETNPMTLDWTNILWNITQQDGLLDPDILVTFTRHFERVDDAAANKRIRNRSRLATVSSGNKKNLKAQSAFLRHDQSLIAALDRGDSVVAFGAEAIISAPNEQKLERAMESIQNYVKANDETRGLSYELDINRQLYPFLLAGPNIIAKNKDVYTEMTSDSAGISAMFVDSGGDRTPGSEYFGLSIGKMIRSHAAYPMINRKALLVGNNTIKKTHTLAGDENMLPEHLNMSSNMYLSQTISRAYLLNGKSVTHLVLDNSKMAEDLMSIKLNPENKMAIDASQGFLNILEVIGDRGENQDPTRIIGRYNTHINNIIVLFSQFRDVEKVSTTDDFASIARRILGDFFISNKYYTENPRENLDQIRLIGDHDQYKTLADFGGWVAQRRKSNKDRHLTNALAELDNIVNNNILPMIPSLNTLTNPVIDDLVDAKYRVVDLSGFNIGSMTRTNDSTTNVMMMAYLNILIPSMGNGDVVFIHGLDKVSKINEIIHDMINSAQDIDLDMVYTATGQAQALKVGKMIQGTLDLTIVDLYKNRIDTLIEPLDISKSYAKSIEDWPAAFFVKTLNGTDYILLDDIL